MGTAKAFPLRRDAQKLLGDVGKRFFLVLSLVLFYFLFLRFFFFFRAQRWWNQRGVSRELSHEEHAFPNVAGMYMYKDAFLYRQVIVARLRRRWSGVSRPESWILPVWSAVNCRVGETEKIADWCPISIGDHFLSLLMTSLLALPAGSLPIG